MTPHIVTIQDFLTPNALEGLAMIAGLFLGMAAMMFIAFTK